MDCYIFYIVYFALGAIGGFLSGLLGIGGALIMIPLMLTVPPLAGLPPLTMQTVSGLSMVQVMFASISGVILHHKHRCVNLRLLWIVGACMFAASLIGAMASRVVPETTLMIVFGAMLILAGVMMMFPVPQAASMQAGPAADIQFSAGRAVLAGLGVGMVAGLVGAGGGFVLIPLLIYGLHIPVKATIGTSLGIVLIGSAAGTIGKAVTNQVHWPAAAALVVGSIVFAQFGARVSQRTPAKALRYLLALIVLVSSFQIWRAILLRLFHIPF